MRFEKSQSGDRAANGFVIPDTLQKQVMQQRSGIHVFLLLFILAAASLPLSTHAQDADVYFLNQHKTSHYTLSTDGRNWNWNEVHSITSEESAEEIGSLWKVYFYVYAVGRDLVFAPEVCTDLNPENCHCGDKNESGGSDLDKALIHSCEGVFKNFKKQATEDDWRKFWQGFYATEILPAWLDDFESFGAETKITPGDVLKSWQGFRNDDRIFERLRAALSLVVREGTAKALVDKAPAATVLIKTFTMGDRVAGYRGGFAGWITPDTLVWIRSDKRGAVTAEVFFEQVRAQVNELFGRQRVAGSAFKVCVNFLNDYPLHSVKNSRGESVYSGRLYGTYTVITKRLSEITFRTQGKISLNSHKQQPVLSGCFNLEEYIARVIEREGDDISLAAKKALAIAARTYLLDEASRKNGGILFIDDDSQKQRVSLSDPREENIQVALATQGLVLSGAVLYHLDKVAPNILTVAVADLQATQGLSEAEILQAAFPSYKIIPMWHVAGVSCEKIPAASEWLGYNIKSWKTRIVPLGADTEFPAEVCRSRGAQAYYFGKRIYVPTFESTDDQLTVAHEWLHGAFVHAPLMDDDEIEMLARELVLGVNYAYGE